MPGKGRRLAPGSLLRTLILATTQSPRIGLWARRYGLRLGASRFVAGETVDDCLTVLGRLREDGVLGYAIALGESLSDRVEVPVRLATYRTLVDRLADADLGATMSLKLTNLGLLIDEQLAYSNAREVIGWAAERGIFVRIDMEDSNSVDATPRTYRRLREAGLSNVGIVLQAYLYRTLSDLESLRDLEPNVRVVKGAYLEPASLAFPAKDDVDRNYLSLIDASLESASFTAIATHDEVAVAHARGRLDGSAEAAAGRYEFQMLFGVRSSLQEDLVEMGHPVRVCVPYGEDWFVYFGRRLAERPANLKLVLRDLFKR